METPTIIISISSLCRKNWTYICNYLNLRIYNIPLQNDQPTDVEIQDNGELLSKQHECQIIYTKHDDSEDITQLTYFFLLKRQFHKIIELSFIIDISHLCVHLEKCYLPLFIPVRSVWKTHIFSKNDFFKWAHLPIKRQDCIYKYGHYLFLITDPKNPLIKYKDNKSKNNKSFPYSKVQLQTDSRQLEKEINTIASRYFIPLLPINTKTIKLFTSNRVSEENIEKLYDSSDIVKSIVSFSVKKLMTYEKNKIKIVNQELLNEDFPSLFEQWVTLAFYHSLCKSLHKSERKKHQLSEIKPVLHSYCNSIYELAKNIIVHTENHKGLLYIIFEDGHDYRELRIGLFDNNKNGVLDTFKDADGISIEQFYNPNELFDYNQTSKNQLTEYLAFRAAAHLGIKTFVANVKAHNGTFRVETNSGDTKKLILDNGVEDISFPSINGTHYEITLPVKKLPCRHDTLVQTASSTSPFIRLFHESVIKEIIPKKHSISNEFKSKKEQTDFIIKIGNQIEQDGSQSQSIVINMDKWRLGCSNLFRLLAYIQLHNRQHFNRIICTNLDDSDIDTITDTLKRIATKCERNHNPVWSITHSVILINKHFRTQILCGETLAEINYVNKQINALYFNTENSFDSYSENSFDSYSENISEEHRNILDKLVLPYENIIEENISEIDKPKIRFINYLEEVIEREIGGKEKMIGCRSEAKNTKIGSKIFIENYYEADFLFHNSFFVDRFAYFIATDIMKWSKDTKIDNEKCVIIGYKAYSELLIQKVKDYIDGYGNNHLIVAECLIANYPPDQQNDSEAHNVLDFSTLYQMEANDADKIITNIITIVPIGSTLSTNDKILSLYCRERNIQSTDKTYNYYNHCSIIIRSGNTDSNNELDSTEQQFWKSIDNNTVFTKFTYAKQIHFTLSKKGIWHYLIDSKTFPEKYTDEIYINKTSNSFLNSSEKFGYPLAPPLTLMGDKLEIGQRDEQRKKWQERLSDIYERGCLSLGHFVIGNNHVRHFIAVEKYINSLDKEPDQSPFNKWIEEVRNILIPKEDNKIHFLIAPYFHYESGFVKFINEKVFDNNAFVLFVDIKSSRENLRRKLTYLAETKTNAHFTFIDNSILTGETYHIVTSFLKDIFPERKFRFHAIITFVSRFSNPVYQTLKESLPKEGKILSYFEMLVSPSKDQENTCSLCALKAHYTELLKYSSVRDCRDIIEKNVSKFKETQIINEIYSKEVLDEKIADKRGFLRLSTRQYIFHVLSVLSSFLSENKPLLESIPEDCTENEWIKSKFQELTNTESVDEKISFVKALSFPPLSQYVKLHEYALSQLLNLLDSTLSSGEPNEDNLNFVKSLLKGLSALGSNALVRKDVIEGSWKFYTEFKKTNPKKGTEFSAFLRFCIKNASYQDKAKSLWLGEYLRTGKEIDVIHYTPDFTVSPFDYKKSPLLTGHDEDFRNCLLSMYYDNTTITRKALDDFETERLKDIEIRKHFESTDSEGKWRLKPFEHFKEKNNLDHLVNKYKSVVDNEYYYSWFKQLIRTDQSPDNIHYIRKLCIVLYARLFFHQLLGPEKQEAPFDKNAVTLLQIFASIVDADASFVSIKVAKGETPFTLATTLGLDMKGNEHSIVAPYFEEAKWKGLPLLVEPNLYQASNTKHDKYNSTCFFPLETITETMDSKSPSWERIGIVAFLFKNHPSTLKEKQDFFIQKISNGRLMLLLKPETDEYVKQVSDGKQFKLWAEKQIFADLNDTTKHDLTLGQVTSCFDFMPDSTYRTAYMMIDLFSNVVVRKLYGEFQKNGQISMDYSSEMTFNDILEYRFIEFIRTRAKDVGVRGTINITSTQNTFPFCAHKYIFQALIYQCILNVKKFNDKKKQIDIKLSEEQLIIRNNFPNKNFLHSIKKDADEFNYYYKPETINLYRRGEINYRYGFTIISLMYYCKYCKLNCDIIYNINEKMPDESYFMIKISRNNQ